MSSGKTLGAAPPEQHANGPVDIRADLRCLACSHFLGEVLAQRVGRSVAINTFTPGPLFRGRQDTVPRRCDKCGASALFLDEEEFVRAGVLAAAA